MTLPRWTVFPAIFVLAGIFLVALPHPARDPYEGAAESLANATRSVPRPAALPTPEGRYPRLVVLGIDGLDPDLLEEAVARFPDRTTNFRWLVERTGGVRRLGTSCPPQSPVAWSNFITGMDPGGHGIFDFIHRDRTTRGIASSITMDEPGSELDLWGDWQLPVGGSSHPNRTGAPFWAILREENVPADLFRMPINVPVEPSEGLSFPGMMMGALDSAYGECTLYTTNAIAIDSDYEKIIPISEYDGRVDTYLKGPANPYKKGHPSDTSPLKIFVDRESNAVAVETEEDVVVLRPGEWSDFLRVSFDPMPAAFGTMAAHGIVRFYLRSIHPDLVLYASPINHDPASPMVPVSEPTSASAELADSIGLYYTQGMAEDVNALKNGVLTDAEFMQQVGLVYRDRREMLDYALDRYVDRDVGGLLFFYFSTVDLGSHMMWRHSDPQHPAYDAEVAIQDSSSWSGRPGSTWKDTIYDLILQVDPAIGEIRRRLGENVSLILMSDHGFAPYNRKFSLNTWLLENGYLVLREGVTKERAKGDPEFKQVYISGKRAVDPDDPGAGMQTLVDWSRTRAYGVGFNGLYLNLAGRELDDPDTREDEAGVVRPGAEAEALLDEIATKLEAIIDTDGRRVVVRCDRATEVYEGPRIPEAPDLLIGYNTGYGNSDPASLGRIPHNVLEDNTGGTFNGSHLMAPEVVQGTLLASVPLREGPFELEDLTVEILRHYGVTPPAAMKGRAVLKATAGAASPGQ